MKIITQLMWRSLCYWRFCSRLPIGKNSGFATGSEWLLCRRISWRASPV